MTITLSGIGFACLGMAYMGARATWLTHFAQLEHYQVQGYFRYHFKKMVLPLDVYVLACALVSLYLSLAAGPTVSLIAIALPMIFLSFLQALRWRRATFKKPLVWTTRARRLAIVYFVIGIVEALVFGEAASAAAVFIGAFAVPNMLLSLVATKPIEAYVHHTFKRRASARLRQLQQVRQLKIVGITGSYGKTSSKYILGTILRARYDVLVTPNSFNTPMGICKTVNDQLTPNHDVFVAEMGARHRGDIRELVKLVRPDYAMITSVGPAHLETFGSIANIAHTKFDLARGVKESGVVVVNGDNVYCREEAKTLKHQPIFYGIESPSTVDAFAKDIHMDEHGTSFILAICGEQEIECTTKLLGEHNVQNVVGAALLAYRMGLSPAELKLGIQNIEPVEHRLQLIDPGTGVLVIDDAFNANPEGAAMALSVLSQFHGRRKWIVTPGMVELGHDSASFHAAFGRQIAKACDRVILVGRMNQAAMLGGLRAENYPEEQIHVAKTFHDATEIIRREVVAGDVVLFENDLPNHLE